MSGILAEVNEADFKSAVVDYEGLVMVDFWATWCGPCRMLTPTLEQVQQELGDRIKIVKVNIEENQEISTQYNITNIPFMMVFKNGEVVKSIVGNQPKSQLLKQLEPLMA